ncbi:hypothetical protein GCG54_00015405 [Colletotrichum gloeosporioides]|uniref:Uncharacterized protein n=1 Tax=Colletotrichum gloeosporioides TaxID=474922 RepID=A0A8H4CKX6_COLGL|nr:uncharacterized protein GCG54_00015405 [Colletotrichum gloeosporioides]KAF3805845.1 hypothetical protein GCG54_00015405 [Colletotrichum gloeosporioides]
MFTFDNDVSKPYTVIKNFRDAELNMDDGSSCEDNEVDSTDIIGCQNHAFAARPKHNAVRNSVVAGLPGDIDSPRQLRYAVIKASKSRLTDKTAVLGKAFKRGTLDSPLPKNILKADLLIISSDVDENDKRDQFFQQVLKLTKPEAAVLIVVKQEPIPG